MPESPPKKEEKKAQSEPRDALIIGLGLVVAVLVLAVTVVYLLAGASSRGMVVYLPRNTVLFVVSGDENSIAPLKEFAEAHGLSTFVWDLDHPPAYISLGDRNVPLTPPVMSVPTYLCRAADANSIIGYFGTDLNVFKLVVSRCYGYNGPRYVYDENTNTVVEVNG